MIAEKNQMLETTKRNYIESLTEILIPIFYVKYALKIGSM